MITKILSWGALTILLGLCIHGFVGLSAQPRFALPWTDGGLMHLAIFSIAFAVVGVVIEWRSRSHAVAAYAAVGLLIAIASVGATPVFAVAYFGASCLVLGHWMLGRYFAGCFEPAIGALFAILLGAAVLVTALTPTMWLPIHYKAVYLVVLGMPLFLCPNRTDAIRGFLGSFERGPEVRWADRCTRAAIAYFSLLYLIFVLQPEIGHDALAVHLAVPAYVANNHFWHFDVVRHVWAVMPFAGEWLYTWTYLLGGEFAARIANYGCLLIIVGLIFRFAERRTSPAIAGIVSVVFLSTPLALLETGTLHIENLQAAFILGAVICAYFLTTTSRISYAYLAAIFMGISMAVKLGSSASLAAPIAIISFVLLSTPGIRRWRALGALIVCFVLFGGFHYANALVVTGNPIFPFMNSHFDTDGPFGPSPSPQLPNPHFAQGLTFDALYRVTFDSGSYLETTPGAAGFAFLPLLPIALIAAIVRRDRAALVFAGASLSLVILVFSGMAYLRYVYPAAPLFALMMPNMFAFARTVGRSFFYALIVVSAVSVALNVAYLPSPGWLYRDLDLRVAFDAKARDAFITARTPVRRAIEFLNAADQPGVRVAFMGSPYISELDGEALTANWYNFVFSRDLRGAQSDEDRLAVFSDAGITHFITDHRADRYGTLSLIQGIAEPIQQFGTVVVWKTRDAALFPFELLRNTEFETGTAGWSGTAQHVGHVGSVLVTVSEALSQAIHVDPDRRYLLTIRARCHSPGAAFRLQANWLDESGVIIAPTIRVRACKAEFFGESLEMDPPEGARRAVVYAIGYTDKTVEIDSVSFRSTRPAD